MIIYRKADSIVWFCHAQVREPDQHHQDERDDIATIVWRPETGLLKGRVAGLPRRHSSSRLDKNDTSGLKSEIMCTGRP